MRDDAADEASRRRHVLPLFAATRRETTRVRRAPPGMKARTTLLPSLFLIVTAHAAGADAIDDFATGAVVRVERATVDLGNGPRGSTGTGELRKRADSLDLTINAADLGVALPIALHLRGTRLDDGLLRYEIDERFESRIDLGGGHVLVGVSGRLLVRAQPLAGRDRPTVGNVRLVLAESGQAVRAHRPGRGPDRGRRALDPGRPAPAPARRVPRPERRDGVLGPGADHALARGDARRPRDPRPPRWSR
jgi:hypothetical protein